MAEKVIVLGIDHPHVFALANDVKETDSLELAGVWCAQEDQKAQASEKMGVPVITTVEEALALKPALVIIGALPCDRAKLAVQATKAGASVLVDKPLALNEQSLDEVIAASTEANRPVIAYYPYRGHPLVTAAKDLVDAGRIGKLVRIFCAGPHKLNAPTRPDWHWTREGNGGAMIDIGSHHADLMCWFMGEAPVSTTAFHTNLSQPEHPEFQDFAQAQFEFPSGALGHIEVDWLNPASFNNFGDTRFWFQGTEGKIELRLGDEVSGYLWTNDVAGEALKPNEVDMQAWDRKLLTDLAAGKTGEIPQEDVWRTSRVTLAAFASAEQAGQKVSI